MNFSTDAISKLLDVYPAQAAVIDEQCKVLGANRSWKEFSIHNGFEAWRPTLAQPCVTANDDTIVSQGIRSVLSGAEEQFTYTYESSSPAGTHYFRLTAYTFALSKERRWAILLNTELTHLGEGDLLSVCAWCKRVQEGDRWRGFEEHFSKQGEARFNHGICPECRDRILQEISG
jgi:hypothetical protein